MRRRTGCRMTSALDCTAITPLVSLSNMIVMTEWMSSEIAPTVLRTDKTQAAHSCGRVWLFCESAGGAPRRAQKRVATVAEAVDLRNALAWQTVRCERRLSQQHRHGPIGAPGQECQTAARRRRASHTGDCCSGTDGQRFLNCRRIPLGGRVKRCSPVAAPYSPTHQPHAGQAAPLLFGCMTVRKPPSCIVARPTSSSFRTSAIESVSAAPRALTASVLRSLHVSLILDSRVTSELLLDTA